MEKNTGIKRILMAGVYSFNGIQAAIRHEAAFRQEAILAAVALVLVVFLDLSRMDRVVLIGVTVLVLIVELLNSAVEAVVDRIGPELHTLSGRAKDMGSAAVLLSIGLWVYAWFELVVLGVWFS